MCEYECDVCMCSCKGVKKALVCVHVCMCGVGWRCGCECVFYLSLGSCVVHILSGPRGYRARQAPCGLGRCLRNYQKNKRKNVNSVV